MKIEQEKKYIHALYEKRS